MWPGARKQTLAIWVREARRRPLLQGAYKAHTEGRPHLEVQKEAEVPRDPPHDPPHDPLRDPRDPAHAHV